ncbi:type VI secretion system-associated FHA domain protein TagH [Marinobacter nanhaiticus D15-8W]|uniref:Type VI secretion system-associated FHA domain protein TagH n=1 Tax=Marinobacter nanhaiticus D15-8W TaxID=626887 RepID=N6VYY3_9GAMM|nr:type VI secretion system-associated FHA domain protein TagH [Marinobacter nanhaiticus]ENO15480.1 type VI secretion system-associated FHA domain protein TagH [Marinobacter nanhaiticus D15-8W]BES73670.1 type VI secretion system-associated FHA domain protein TagH [Marinobacter nanhaiticus D15-8W]
MDATQTKLRLTISNPREVGGGADIACEFGVKGGSIGSATSDTWRLSPHRTGVVSGHAEIRWIDGQFCLIDRSGRTYINSASLPVGRGRRARLVAGDKLRLGKYEVQADLVKGAATAMASIEGEADDPSLVNTPEGSLYQYDGDQPRQSDPLDHLDPAPSEREQRDPMEGFTYQDRETVAEEKRPELLNDDPAWRGSVPETSDPYMDERERALRLPVINGGQRNMDEVRTEHSHQTHHRHEDSEQSRKHISGAPLLRGMDTDLRFNDSDDMRLFLEEAGQTLNATIQGLLDLHQHEDSRHRALRTRLQPIEDNPLRLGQDYESTMQTLFASERSPVHLSAPAAVTESLAGLRDHQQATQAAIGEALNAILHAFSPENLLRRFHGYRRGLQTNESEPAWAWEMYKHYYEELRSSRQRGFERLFEEVFEQAYDHHLRQLQRESTL